MKQAISAQKTTSFTMYVNENMESLRKYCRSLTKSSWDADDLMQETLLKAFKSWKKSPRELSKAFFIRIASNTWIDHYRKKTVTIEESQDVYDIKIESGAASDEHHQLLEQVMKKLSPKQRVAMLLTEGLELTAGETAHYMGESIGAVKAALHRARRKLKDVEIDTLMDNEEESMIPYLNALSDGMPENIVHLYQQETGTPMMSLTNKKHFAGVNFTSFVWGQHGTSYVLITVRLKNGNQLTIPIYGKEGLTILAYLTEENETFALSA